MQRKVLKLEKRVLAILPPLYTTSSTLGVRLAFPKYFHMFTDFAATLALGRRVEFFFFLRLLKCYFDWSSLVEQLWQKGAVVGGGAVQSSSFRVLKSIFMFSWRQVPRCWMEEKPAKKKKQKQMKNPKYKNKNNVDDNTNNNSRRQQLPRQLQLQLCGVQIMQFVQCPITNVGVEKLWWLWS